MQTQSWIKVQSHNHLFSLNTNGSIRHAIHQLGQPVRYETVTANEPILQYCVLPNNGEFHMAATTPSSIYYLKFGEHRDQRSRLLFRIGLNHQASHPYLFFYKSKMYICYLQLKDEQCMLIIKSYISGVWEERTIIVKDNFRIHLEDVAYGVGKKGQFYVLFRYSNSHRENVLSSLQYDLENESHQFHQLFLVKNPECRWTIGLGIDDQGKAHFSWTIYNSTTVTYHYTNLYHENMSFRPLFFNCNDEPMIPYFLFIKDCIFLLFWNGKQLIRFFYSLNFGKHWSKEYDIHYQPLTPLYMIQSVLSDRHRLTAPIRLLGIGLPFFRPFEMLDFFNPFTWLTSSSPSREMLSGVKRQLEQMHSYLLLQSRQLQQEISGLSMENEELQRNILHSANEYEQWETEEKKALQTLKRLKSR